MDGVLLLILYQYHFLFQLRIMLMNFKVIFSPIMNVLLSFMKYDAFNIRYCIFFQLVLIVMFLYRNHDHTKNHEVLFFLSTV